MIAVEEDEKKRRKLQNLANKQQQNASVPSKVFKFIDRKFSTDYIEYPSGNSAGQEGGSASASKNL